MWTEKKINIENSEKEFFKLFIENKKKIFKKTVKIFSLILLSLAINGLQILYPYHFIISIIIFSIAIALLIKNLLSLKKIFDDNKTYSFIKNFIIIQKRKLLLVLILVLLSFMFLLLNPQFNNPFRNLSENELNIQIENDLKNAIIAIDFLESSGNSLLQKLETTSSTSTSDSIKIKNAFDDFLKAIIFSEKLTDVHKYFNSIKNPKKKLKSFLIAYSLYIKKYEIIHKLIIKTSQNSYYKKILNQYTSQYDKKNIFSNITLKFYNPKTVLRINTGYIFLKNKKTNILDKNSNFLKNKSIQSYKYLFSNLDKTILNFPEIHLDTVQNRMFDLWFPIQKNIANSIGHTIISPRGNTGLLSKELKLKLKNKMIPGDIMIQRRNWHMTNIGIPGFWTHGAFYTGDLSEMNSYFKPIFPYNNYNNFEDLLKDEYPKIYSLYKTTNTKSELNKISVIEALEPGVILQTLNDSANADFVIALRPKLSKKRKMQAILTAFSHYKKPYDYYFDFDTRDSLVCSELIYYSYYPTTDKLDSGLHFKYSFINSRRIVTPIDIAKKFKNEYKKNNNELDFVFFIKSSEKDGSSSIGTIKEFIESVEWSKFSLKQL